MELQTEQDVLNWYDGQERVLTKDFLETIPWQDVRKHELDESFIPVLVYMRDVERFTEIYYDELRKTPTGNDPVIKRFMERWAVEETLHSDLLHRFLCEAGYPAHERWYEEAKAKIPKVNTFKAAAIGAVTQLFGKHFSAVHMTWGAINELSTLSGYQRLWQLANHPVLTHLLNGIAREEARHSLFYWSIAKLKLQHSPFRQQLTRTIVRNFWAPVGSGLKAVADTNYVITRLFGQQDGLAIIDQQVSRRINQLPGLATLSVVTERIAETSQRA